MAHLIVHGGTPLRGRLVPSANKNAVLPILCATLLTQEPVRLRGMLKVLRRYSLDECRRIAARILEAPRTLDVQKVLVNIETS